MKGIGSKDVRGNVVGGKATVQKKWRLMIQPERDSPKKLLSGMTSRGVTTENGKINHALNHMVIDVFR